MSDIRMKQLEQEYYNYENKDNGLYMDSFTIEVDGTESEIDNFYFKLHDFLKEYNDMNNTKFTLNDEVL